MRTLWLAAAACVSACSHGERTGTTAGESVPRPQVVIDNAIPRDLPPATPPIPASAGSAQIRAADGGAAGSAVVPMPDHQPSAPAPDPFGGNVRPRR